MQRRYNLVYFILTSVVVLVLTLLVAVVNAQEQIAFSSNRDGNSEIYVMNANGRNQRNLTITPFSHDSSPSWSPDGKHIAFSSERDGDIEIYVMDANGGNQRNLTNNPHVDNYPSWSPDGEHIVFMSDRAGSWDIYVMRADGKRQRNLTNNPHRDMDPAWFAPTFAVAPTSKQFTIWGWLKQFAQ